MYTCVLDKIINWGASLNCNHYNCNNCGYFSITRDLCSYYLDPQHYYDLILPYTVNQKVCSSHQVKRESLVTIVTPKYGVMRTPHRLGVKYTPNLVWVWALPSADVRRTTMGTANWSLPPEWMASKRCRSNRQGKTYFWDYPNTGFPTTWGRLLYEW